MYINITEEILLANNFKKYSEEDECWQRYKLEIKDYGIIDITLFDSLTSIKIADKKNKMHITLPYKTVEKFNEALERINWEFRLVA